MAIEDTFDEPSALGSPYFELNSKLISGQIEGISGALISR